MKTTSNQESINSNSAKDSKKQVPYKKIAIGVGAGVLSATAALGLYKAVDDNEKPQKREATTSTMKEPIVDVTPTVSDAPLIVERPSEDAGTDKSSEVSRVPNISDEPLIIKRDTTDE